MENKICCFFGHRDAPEELLPSLVSLLEELTEQQGITVFWVGGHGQFDRLAAEAVCRLRERFPRIRLELVAAYPYAAENHLAWLTGRFYRRDWRRRRPKLRLSAETAGWRSMRMWW